MRDRRTDYEELGLPPVVTAVGREELVRLVNSLIGRVIELRASEGVILACGGFEGNDEWRREYLPLPTDAAWTSGLASNSRIRAMPRS